MVRWWLSVRVTLIIPTGHFSGVISADPVMGTGHRGLGVSLPAPTGVITRRPGSCCGRASFKPVGVRSGPWWQEGWLQRCPSLRART